jgi:hypothetical protein
MENPVRIVRSKVAWVAACLIGAVAGALLWQTLPVAASISEPWDDTGLYSIGLLFGSWLRVLARGKRGFLFAIEALRRWPNSVGTV